MRKTYIGTTVSRRRDRGVADREGSLDLGEGLPRLDHPTKNVYTGMLRAAPRHHQHHIVGLLLNGAIYLRMKTLDSRALLANHLFGFAKVLGKRGLRLAQIGRLQLHLLPPSHIDKRLLEYNLLRDESNVVHIK
jgi:hypothetical protein